MENRPQISLPNSKQVLFELPTGRGKTKTALDYLHSKKCIKPLIVLPKRVLETNWNEEIKKWNYDNEIKPIYIQYASFIKPQKWMHLAFDSIIMDESHHLSQRCIQTLQRTETIWKNLPIVLLSATVTQEQKINWKSRLFPKLFIVQDTLQNVIAEGTLPMPTICYIRCELPDNLKDEYGLIQNNCSYWKKRAKLQPKYEKMYLTKCRFRNIWLAKQKTEIVKEIVQIYNKQRTLTFCADIKHCEEVNPISNITSANKAGSEKILAKFNNKEYNHITACNMLNEGVNLIDCQVGIFAYLTISERLNTQKVGRLIRHPKPIIYIVYFAYTRDEEIKEEIERKFQDVSIPKYYTQEFIMNYRKKKGLL